MLPDQMTPAALDELVKRYERSFAEQRVEERAFNGRAPDSVRGGQLTTRALGFVEVDPNRTLSGIIRSPLPIVEVIFRWPRHQAPGSFVIQTSAARLIRQNQRFLTEAYTTQATTRHFVEITKHTREVRLAFEVFTDPFICGPLVADTGQWNKPDREWLIPAAANAIIGVGLLRYLSGAEQTLAGQAQLLQRLDDQFNFGFIPGGVYARFVGPEPASVRIGNSWLSTLPATL